MNDMRRRLERLEGAGRPAPEDERQREEERKRIRDEAARINSSREREDKEPLFEITEDGTVYALDGRLVDNWHQTGAELFYWQQVEWGTRSLIHDEEAEAFCTPDGELAVSRDRFDLRSLLSH
jgi:hypothetical protein